MAKGKKYYAIARGRKPGVYDQWYGDQGAEAQVKGFPGAVFKGFPTRREAEAWLKQPDLKPPAAGARSTTPKKQGGGAPRENDVVVYTDGGCNNNPGPGGFGVVIMMNGDRTELSGGFRLTTNNRMELMGCIIGLGRLEKRTSVTVYSDSQYVVNGITKGWAKSWRARGWKKSDGQNALNPDLWERLLELCEYHDVQFVWVRGHAGNEENERCDQLATAAAAKDRLPVDAGFKGSG